MSDDQEHQELREWAAGLMGWYLQKDMVLVDSGRTCAGYFNKSGLIIYQDNYRPDSPDAPMSQLLGVIEKLEEDGAEVIIHKTQTRIFYKGCWYQHRGEGRILNTLKAIQEAVKSTGEK